ERAGLLRWGATVRLRHAKASELAEHALDYRLLSGGEVVAAAPTYRGEGRLFLGRPCLPLPSAATGAAPAVSPRARSWHPPPRPRCSTPWPPPEPQAAGCAWSERATPSPPWSPPTGSC